MGEESNTGVKLVRTGDELLPVTFSEKQGMRMGMSGKVQGA